MGEGKPKRWRSPPRRRGRPRLIRWMLTVLLAIPATYLVAALIGSLIPVNSGWSEAEDGITIYLADNGIHADVVMPVEAQGLDWAALFPRGAVAPWRPHAQWIAFGSGEEKVYLETPTWWDIRPKTMWSALTGGNRVMHVEYVESPAYAERAIRLRPEEYRRLWSAIRADFKLDASGLPARVDHPGYGPSDAFYWSSGSRFSALSTCNTWVAGRFRLAGIETSLWPPFVPGLLWRYRKVDQRT